MGRAYKMKGQNRKNKDERYDREQPVEMAGPSKKVKTDGSDSEKEENLEITACDIPGIPMAPVDTANNKQRVIFVLEKASLEVDKVGKNFQLLSSDEHAAFLAKSKRNPADYRPDIAFQAIQTILDSRVNKSGRLKALHVKTQQGRLLEIKPHTRLPRTYKRFSGLMVQLLQDLSITVTGNGNGNGEKLLRLIQNPVTQYLPTNSRKIGFSHSSEKLIDMHNYVGKINDELDLVFVLGAMSHGKIDEDYVEDYISISEYPLSAAYAISIITNAVERKFKIL
ncbi:rRNA small subunit pseudouridine methyltransferase Nep1 [Salvia divinorum]|uniref:rRNA small subunit pseudouridine methyltransferase Nep1 n=1 Tax=Salvia divinorum TaxID=28513 RepID=A0ABD1IIJ9_SALDI